MNTLNLSLPTIMAKSGRDTLMRQISYTEGLDQHGRPYALVLFTTDVLGSKQLRERAGKEIEKWAAARLTVVPTGSAEGLALANLQVLTKRQDRRICLRW